MDTSALRFFQQENARLQEENKALHQEILLLQRSLTVAQELFDAYLHFEQAETPLEGLDRLLLKVIEACGAKDGSISRLDKAAGELVFVLVHGDIWQELRGYRIKSDTGVAGWVVSSQEPVIINQAQQDWRFSFKVDQEFNFSTQSMACAPIMAGDELIGVIELLNKRGDFTQTDLVLLAMLGQVAARVLTTEEALS